MPPQGERTEGLGAPRARKPRCAPYKESSTTRLRP